jgi:RES domain-containing protein
VEVYRITQKDYANDLSGNGARLYGGRWNSEGLFAVYTSSFRSLALLETLAHAPAKMLTSKIYILITLSIPDKLPPQIIEYKKLAIGWDASDIRQYTQKMGDDFLLQKKDLLLSVPSVLIPEEMNYVLNPLHADMKKVKIVHNRRIYFDKRVGANL